MKHTGTLPSPLPGRSGLHRELAESELHNFAGSVPLKGQGAGMTVGKSFLSFLFSSQMPNSFPEGVSL